MKIMGAKVALFSLRRGLSLVYLCEKTVVIASDGGCIEKLCYLNTETPRHGEKMRCVSVPPCLNFHS